MTFEDELLALERRVLEGAGGDFFQSVAVLRRMLAMEAPGIEAAILKLAVPQLQAAAVSGVGEAWSLGGGRALDSAMLGGLDANAIGDASELRVKTGPPKRLSDPLDGLDGLLSDAKTKASALLRSGVGADAALAPIFNAATTARLRVTTQINAASNQAALEVGDATSSPMVWEAERDACVYCLALAGEVVETPGQSFPRADLYADPPPSQWTVERPPLHGHCRCQLAVLVEPSYADTLKREAQRSILRGTSLSSESNAVRIRAASRLLERDPIAPKSVKEYARKAVKAGTFPKGREVPTGDPRLVITRGGGEPPKPPAMPPPAAPAPPLLREQIAKLKPADAAAAATARHGIPFEDWDGMQASVAREAISIVSELLDRFPGSRFLKVNGARDPSLRISNRTMAYVATTHGEKVGRMHFVRAHMNEKRLLETGERNHAAGFLAGSADTWQDALRHTVTHEFVHGLDANVGKALSALYVTEKNAATAGMSFPELNAWTNANISKYGRTNAGEGVAELMAEALNLGDNARPFARQFLPKALDLIRSTL